MLEGEGVDGAGTVLAGFDERLRVGDRGSLRLDADGLRFAVKEHDRVFAAV